MNFVSLIDGPSTAIVIGGTLIATLLRCGLSDCRVTLRVLGRLGKRRFNADKVRSELALQVQEIQQDGLIRAHPHMFGDREFDEATGAMIERRSVSALLDKHEDYKTRRRKAATTASQTMAQAAELAPVFGLASTLISLSQMPGNGIDRDSYIMAISMAVTSTLYGLLAANIVFAPLSRAIERAIAFEENEREKIFDWLAGQVATAIHLMPRRTVEEAAE